VPERDGLNGDKSRLGARGRGGSYDDYSRWDRGRAGGLCTFVSSLSAWEAPAGQQAGARGTKGCCLSSAGACRHATPLHAGIFRGCLCALSALRWAAATGAGLSSTSTLHCNRKRKSRSACIALVRWPGARRPQPRRWAAVESRAIRAANTAARGRVGIMYGRAPAAGPGHLDVLAFTLAVLLQWAHFRNTLFFLFEQNFIFGWTMDLHTWHELSSSRVPFVVSSRSSRFCLGNPAVCRPS